MIAPLNIHERSKLAAPLREKVFGLVPIIGWFAGFAMQCARIGAVVQDLQSQLLQRSVFPKEEWSGHRAPIWFVKRVSISIQHTLNWPNPNFLPNDAWECICLEEEGVGELIIMLDLEADLGVLISDDEAACLADSTFGDVVEFFWQKYNNR